VTKRGGRTARSRSPRAALKTVRRLPVAKTTRRWPWFVLLVAVGVSALAWSFAEPVRAATSQDRKVKDARAELARIEADVARLEVRMKTLMDPAEVERIARSEYGMIRPGQEAYTIVVPTEPGLPAEWPYQLIGVALRG
jgi:cell division protein FtsB